MPNPSNSTELRHRGRRSISADHKVIIMTVAMATVAIALGTTTGLSAFGQPLLDTPARWWFFIPLFALVDWSVVHIEVRRESYGLALTEPIILLALFLIGPMGLVVARSLGGAAAMRLRRQPPAKLCFNTALFALEASVAAACFQLLLRPTVSGDFLWIGAGAVVLATSLLTDLLVTIVISFYDRDRPARLAGATVRAHLIMATATICLALVGLAAIATYPMAIIALGIVLAGVGVVLREQAATVKRASNLDLISTFTSRLAGAGRTDDVLATLIGQACEALRSEYGSIATVRPGTVLSGSVPPPGLVELLANINEPTLIRDIVGGPGERTMAVDGVAAPIKIGQEQATLIVWERINQVGTFDTGDLLLLAGLIAPTEIAAERAALGDQLARAANFDGLTELANRRGFEAEFELQSRAGGALLMIGLDRFKDLNDTLGHDTGDRALAIIAQRLNRFAPSTSLLGRLGGDEFALFVPHCSDLAAATSLAEDVLRIFEEPIQLLQMSLHVRASIGIARSPNAGADLSDLLRYADVAMHLAKRRQSGWAFYRSEDDTNSPRRLELLASLRPAIEAAELEVWYQPKVRTETGAVVGLEALARWQHPRFGFVPPDEFIELAENAGLMRDLTEFVLSRVMADTAQRCARGLLLPVAVNLSTRNLLDDTLVDRLTELLTVNGIDATLISFEVTETAMMIDRERVIGVLQSIRDRGFDLAVDDFGTGYSSLAYLRDLPIDELKIDRVFVTDVDIDSSNERIVRSTVELAHGFGLRVVAEGVERPGELQTLRAIGCDEVQGYLIARPLPNDRLDRWLAEYDPKTIGAELPVI